MTISELIYSHFSKNAKKTKLSVENLASAAKETFDVQSFSKKENDVLLSLVSAKLTMDDDKKEYYYRSMAQFQKDLKQSLTSGVFGEEINEKKFFEGMKEYAAKKAAAEEGEVVLPELNENHSFMRSSQVYYYAIKKLGEITEETTDNHTTFKFNHLSKWGEIKPTETQKLILTSLVESTNRLIDEYNASVEGDDQVDPAERDCVAYLSSMLVLESLNNERDKESQVETRAAIQEAFSALVPYVCYSIDESIVNESNIRIFSFVSYFASKRIEQLNSVLSEKNQFTDNVDKCFRDAKLGYVIDKVRPTDFKELRATFGKQGSNFSFSIIDEQGTECFADPVVRSQSQEEAISAIKSDLAFTALSGFAYFDYKLLAGREDQDIDSFLEVSEMLLTNLLIADNIEMQPEVKEMIQEVFVVPFIQAFAQLEPKDQKEVCKCALANIIEINDVLDNDVTEIYDLDGYDIARSTVGKAKYKEIVEDFRSFVKNFADNFNKKRGALRKNALKRNNPERDAVDRAIRIYQNNELPINKYYKDGFGQDPNAEPKQKWEYDSLFRIPNGRTILKTLYSETYYRARELKKLTEGKSFSKQELKEVVKECGLSEDSAEQLVMNTVRSTFKLDDETMTEIYGETFTCSQQESAKAQQNNEDSKESAREL